MQKQNRIKQAMTGVAFMLLFAVPCAAQPNHYRQIDSLQQLYKSAKTDTAKSLLLTLLGQYYFPINPDSGFAYSRKALYFSKAIGWKKGEVLALKAVGSNYWATADYLKCQDYFLQMRDVALGTGDSALISIAYHALAISYLPLVNTDKGIEYLQKALSIEKCSNDPNRLMSIYHNLGDIYEGKKDFRQALFYYTNSLPAANKANHWLGIAFTYLKMGTLNIALDSLTTGFGYLQKSLALSRNLKEQPPEVLALISLGEVHRKRKQYNHAVAYYDSALAMSATFKAKHYIGLHGTYLLAAAELYREKARYEKEAGLYTQSGFDLNQAITHLKKSLQVSGSVPDWVAMREEAKLLSDMYSEMGRAADALVSYKNFVSYGDSVENIEKAKQKVQHDMRVVFQDSLQYIKKLQDKQLQILAQENKLNRYKTNQLLLFAAIIIVGFALVAAVFLNRYRLQKIRFSNALQTEKLQKQWREAELQHQLNDMTLTALHTQMNPHFIFNVLNTIQSFIYTDNKRAATSYLAKFSELMRKTLDYSRRQTITLEEEWEIIRLYLTIEKARFDNQLSIKLSVDETLPLSNILLPPLFVQPYIENAFKHGLLHQQGEKKLLIDVGLSEKMDAVIIRIDDNGIGRKQSAAINKSRLNHHSFASEANEKRADLMKELWGKKIDVQIEDKISPEGFPEGTTISIRIPVEKATLMRNSVTENYGQL